MLRGSSRSRPFARLNMNVTCIRHCISSTTQGCSNRTRNSLIFCCWNASLSARQRCAGVPWVESWAAWESRAVMLKADGPAVSSLWSIDCKEAWVTAAVRTGRRKHMKKQTGTLLKQSRDTQSRRTYTFRVISFHSNNSKREIAGPSKIWPSKLWCKWEKIIPPFITRTSRSLLIKVQN